MSKWGSPSEDTQKTQLHFKKSSPWNIYIIIIETFNYNMF